MELELRRDCTPEVYRRYIRENRPDKDENFLYYNVIRTDLISEYFLFEEPDTHETHLGEILKCIGIDPEDYNLFQKYSEAVRNIRAEVATYNKHVEESGLDWPLLDVVVDKTQTGINQRSRWIGDPDAKINYEEIDENEFGRLRTYKIVEKERSESS